MPEEAKKKQQKGRNDPKEQRRPRQRHPPGPAEKQIENKDPEKPVYEEPGPEFYKNLKRETDDILKITEEESVKYKKKEIQSNWSKYEMPIESYDDIQEQENMGADYEKLIEAPLSIGGYFQFKHEKTWDVDSAPSPYDKYFDIDMDKLFLSISTIPFFERHNIQKDIFTETDILNMNNRATRSKQKYFKDKSFSTPEMEIQKSILSQLKNDSQECDLNNLKKEIDTKKVDILKSPGNEVTKTSDEAQNILVADVLLPEDDHELKETNLLNKSFEIQTTSKNEALEDIDILLETKKVIEDHEVKKDSIIVSISKNLTDPTTKTPETSKADPPPPVIESAEDLEKWLDEFLDG